MQNKSFYTFCVVLLLIQCSNSDNEVTEFHGEDPISNDGNVGDDGDIGEEDWLIPLSEVKDGGPGKDGIPSIDAPEFVSISDAKAGYLKDSDLIVGYVNGDEAKAYPHIVLDWHEVVNEKEEGISISYCPLTGTAFAWKTNTTFGVSGLLYNANLIVYDRKTESNWSQLGLLCVNGSEIEEVPVVVQIFEMTWGAWKQLYPSTKVLTIDTGFSRDYGMYPYGSYKTNHSYFIFPVSPTNNAINSKERVFALINEGKSKVYRFGRFGSGTTIKDHFNGVDYLIVGNNEFFVAFELGSDVRDLIFTYDFNSEDNVTLFSDDEGNRWSVEGVALSGPRSGQKLKPSISVTSYWFAIAAFYPNPEIY